MDKKDGAWPRVENPGIIWLEKFRCDMTYVASAKESRTRGQRCVLIADSSTTIRVLDAENTASEDGQWFPAISIQSMDMNIGS